MEPLAAPRFAAIARTLADEARRHGLAPPGFRAPPRLAGARRTIRRFPGGGAVVAVQLRDRPGEEVVADMVEGVVVANGLTGTAADGWRLALVAAAERLTAA